MVVIESVGVAAATVSDSVAVWLPPLYVAVTVAVVVEVIVVLDCTEKLVLLWPAGTVKIEGTGKAALFEERLIVAPPEGAGALSVNDSVAFAPLATVLGLIEKPVRVGRPGTPLVLKLLIEPAAVPALLLA